jgi:acetyltransferase-like isoleucine patch superfamily enzyme
MIILLKRILMLCLSLPKTVYFNFSVFPFKIACKFPFFVHFKTKLNSLHRNTVDINTNITFGMIKIGWGHGSLGIECNRFSYWEIKKDCKVVFNGTAHFAKGVSLRADNSGKIFFGNQFRANQNFFCASNTIISFGNNVVVGWNIHIRDGDGHVVFDQNNQVTNANKPIYIGNKVWLASYASVLKGVIIQDNSIVAYGSIVTKSFQESNIIIGGMPANIVKRNVTWDI